MTENHLWLLGTFVYGILVVPTLCLLFKGVIDDMRKDFRNDFKDPEDQE